MISAPVVVIVLLVELAQAGPTVAAGSKGAARQPSVIPAPGRNSPGPAAVPGGHPPLPTSLAHGLHPPVVALTPGDFHPGAARAPSPPLPSVGLAGTITGTGAHTAADAGPSGDGASTVGSSWLPVTASGFSLLLGGRPTQFRGINAPQAATYYPVNAGCGAQIDLAKLFAQLAPDSLVRVGFGQDRAINPVTRSRDWRALDRVVDAALAAPTHPHLVVSLADQSGICGDGHWLDSSWYSGGYKDVFDDVGDNWPRVSFWQYLQQVVARYAASPAIAIWEPVGEPEAADCDPGYSGAACYGHKTCPADATAVLRSFFDVVGAEVHRLDPAHLVGTGVIGGAQCGWAGTASEVVTASPGVDVATFHDYGSDDVALPPELAERLVQAKGIGKPLLDEEVGIDARDVPGCTPLARRAAELQAKMAAAFADGAAGFMPWDYAEGLPDDHCDTRIRPGDPTMALLR